MELRSGKALEGSSLAKNTKREELSMPLPEELVERILAMVPFPQIFKARTLSKSWNARFSSISSHDDEEKKLLAVSFQKQVCVWSDKWRSFCPIFLLDDFLIGYDHASQQWRRIPFLSALPDVEATKLKVHLHCRHVFQVHLSIVGALLLFTSSHLDVMFVLNIFTGSWKELPALPEDRWPGIPKRLVSSKDMYKVIGFYTDVGCLCAWVYDSKSGAWRTKRLEVLEHFDIARFDVYLNGVIYVMVYVQQLAWGFLAFDVEEETFNLIHIRPTDDILFLQLLPRMPLVACNGTMYIVVPRDSRTVVLLEQLVRGRLPKIIQGPPAALKFGFLSYKASSDGESLFFQGTGRDKSISNGKVLAYNVRKDEWNYFSMNPILKKCLRSYKPPFNFDTSTFQPGMNPFLEV